MPSRLSGVILEAIFDDEGKVIRIAPKIGEFKVEKIFDEEARIKSGNNDDCVENGGNGDGGNGNGNEQECREHEECEKLLPPLAGWERKCIKDSRGKCICQYVPGGD